ncbi:MAG: hypothetical protein KBC33_03725 [Candidatus Pacebacteria bacterium]|nr:hypothetical protein [Candidatus Paceibacterota bacterium]
MQIYDAAGTASALYDLVTHNRLAWQLAEAWDKQHPDDMPIVKACEKLRDDWDKMVWLKRLRSALEFAQLFIILAGIASIVASLYMSVVCAVLVGVFFVVLFMVDLRLVMSIGEEIGQYCKLGYPLREANCCIRDIQDEYGNYGDASDLQKVLDDMCFEIVRIEKLGQEDGLKFINPFPKFHWQKCQLIGLKELRGQFTELVNKLSVFGLVTGDLGAHFGKAEKRWVANCQGVNFQI